MVKSLLNAKAFDDKDIFYILELAAEKKTSELFNIIVHYFQEQLNNISLNNHQLKSSDDLLPSTSFISSTVKS